MFQARFMTFNMLQFCKNDCSIWAEVNVNTFQLVYVVLKTTWTRNVFTEQGMCWKYSCRFYKLFILFDFVLHFFFIQGASSSLSHRVDSRSLKNVLESLCIPPARLTFSERHSVHTTTLGSKLRENEILFGAIWKQFLNGGGWPGSVKNNKRFPNF